MIYRILSPILGIGLIFFILNNALKNIRYKRRGITHLMLGFFLAGVFLFAFFRDYKGGPWINYYQYYLFILAPLVYGVSFAYYYLIHMRGRSIIRKKKNLSKYYFKDYLYLIYRYENDICLVKKKEKYRGLIFKLKHGELHDSFIYNQNRKLGINCRIDAKRIGKVTYKEQRRTYHCYQVSLLEEQTIERLECVNAYQLVNMPMDEFDKEILYRMIIGEPFDLDK